MIDDAQVQHIATLARLKLSAAEREQLKQELSHILDYFKKLDELDTSHVEPMQHVLQTQNVLREDEVRPSVPREQALKNAPEHDGQHFLVPGVFED